jgi:hypothetical protein
MTPSLRWVMGRRLLLAAALLLAALPARAFDPASYNPAILSLSFSEQPAPAG